MSVLIHDTTVINPGPDGVRVLPHHTLTAADGRVTALGPASEFAQRLSEPWREVFHGDRHIVMPGLVNTHHHLYQALTRCLPDVQNKQLFDWLRQLYEAWRVVDHEAVFTAAQVSIAELLLHGCTTTADHFYLFPPNSDVRAESVLDAAATLGIRIHLGRGAMTMGRRAGGLPPDEIVETDDVALEACAQVIDAYHDPDPHALRKVDLAPCSPFNVTRDFMQAVRDLARERGVLLHTHLAETLEEERYCLDRYGCRPMDYLAELDWLGPDVSLAHCVHLNDDEIARIVSSQTAVSHNPTSNLRLGSGIAPLERLLAAGAIVGLGVDGSSSNDGGSMLAAARHALLSARIRPRLTGTADDRAALFPAHRAFLLATAGGAACLRRPELGHLDVGAAADFALFRADDIGLAGGMAHDPVAALVLGDAPRADRVYVAGQEVVHDGHLVLFDERALANRLNTLVTQRFGS